MVVVSTDTTTLHLANEGPSRPLSDYSSSHVSPGAGLGTTKQVADAYLTCLQTHLRSAEDDALLDACIRQLASIAQLLGPTWSVVPFGSAVNGFGTRKSDLDITLVDGSVLSEKNTTTANAMQEQRCENVTENLGSRSVLILKQFRNLLEGDPAFAVVTEVLAARVPIIKLRFRDEIDVDLSCNNIRPLDNTRLLYAFAQQFPVARDLGVAVKLWAKYHGVCGASEGHLSSYSFILMTIYFLQVSPEVQLPCLDGTNSIGQKSLWFNSESLSSKEETGRIPLPELVCRFFKFYTTEFHWGSEVVSARLGLRHRCDAPCFAKLPGRTNARLHIEDPVELGRNLNCVLQEGQEKALFATMQSFTERVNLCRQAFRVKDWRERMNWQAWQHAHQNGRTSEELHHRESTPSLASQRIAQKPTGSRKLKNFALAVKAKNIDVDNVALPQDSESTIVKVGGCQTSLPRNVSQLSSYSACDRGSASGGNTDAIMESSPHLEHICTNLKVGDEVLAYFYGEWSPATVRKIDVSGSDQVEVLWKSEWSVSIVPASEVKLVGASLSIV